VEDRVLSLWSFFVPTKPQPSGPKHIECAEFLSSPVLLRIFCLSRASSSWFFRQVVERYLGFGLSSPLCLVPFTSFVTEIFFRLIFRYAVGFAVPPFLC